jgi:hypothetical protein
VREGGLPARLVLVESSTSPFMDITPDSGFFVVAAKLEPTAITARSLVTGNQAVETVTPASTETISLDITLTTTGPFVTEASPPNGALGVSLSPSIRLTFSEPVDPSTVTTSSLSLSSATPVSGRVVMGSQNRSASFLPDGNLEPLTSYTISATAEILDTSGNPLLPFTSTFRTLDDSIPELNPDALTVSFPDANGFVTVSAPEFSFEGNAAVTIVNLSNGIVVTGNVNGDGSLLFQLRASITDELQIRVLDSSDREVVIEKTEFRGPNGEVAIGRKGGKVVQGDFVLEVPEGALAGASVFTLTPVDLAFLDGLPLPDGAGGFGSGVEVSTGGAVLQKEGDLSFPVPVSAPADAQHIIVRRIIEDGLDTYEVIDTASVVEGKVKTESPPFYGFLVSGMYLNMWVPPTPSGKNPMGAITGIVQESDLSAPSETTPKSVPVAGAKVRREPRKEGDLESVTDRDGRFVILDRFFGEVGPTIPLVAKHPNTGEEETAIAFESSNILSQFATLTRFSRAGEVVFNFPLSPPPPPPTKVSILLFRKNGEARVAITNGFAAVGDELIIKVQFTQPPENVNLSVNGQNVAVSRKDDERVEDQTLFVFEGVYTPQEPRSYTIVAEGRDAFLNLLSARKSFLAAQGGAGNEARLEGPPSIISDSAVPRNGDTGVPVTQVMSVQFTEPVTNVFSGTVTFEELGGTPTPIGLDILGTKVGGAVAPVAFTDEVVALTMTPQRGLKFATKYRLTFSTTIRDTDLSPTGQPEPKFLSSETNVIEFETFKPTKLGEAPLQGNLVAMTTLDQFAFVALQQTPDSSGGSFGNLQLFDLSDPTKPTKVGEDSLFIGSMVRDVDVEKKASGGSDILGVLSFNPRSGNSELTLFDVSTRESPFPYAGFVTTVVPGEGANFQMDLHEEFAYVAIGSGIKIVNLSEANELFRDELRDKTKLPIGLESVPFDVQRGLFTRGVGFGQQAVQNQIQIPDTSGNLRVSAIQVDGEGAQRLGYVGSLSDIDQIGRFTTLNLANTPTASILATVQLKTLPDLQGNIVRMGFPSDIELTDIGADKYAVIAGGSSAANGRGTLAILKVTKPDEPQLVTVIELKGGWGTNLAIDEDGVTVFVSTSDRSFKDDDGKDVTVPGGVEIYNLANPGSPLFAGSVHQLEGGAGSLALNQGILTAVVSDGGIRTAALAPYFAIREISPFFVKVDEEGNTLEPLEVTYQLIAPPRSLSQAAIRLLRQTPGVDQEAAVVSSFPLQELRDGVFQMTIPAGQPLRVPRNGVAIHFSLPNGEPMSPFLTSVETILSPDLSQETQSELEIEVPGFQDVSPKYVLVGSGETEIQVLGAALDGVRDVQVRDHAGQWHSFGTSERTPGSLKFRMPASVLTEPGFLQIAPRMNAGDSVAFLVAGDLAGFGTAEQILLADADPPDIGGGSPTITVAGDGFEQGMAVILGRGAVPGIVLPTSFVSASEVVADLPPGPIGKASDLVVAVTTRDRQQTSAAIPVASDGFDALASLAERIQASQEEGEPIEPQVTRVIADLRWNEGEQKIRMEGFGIGAGMQVQFETNSGTFTSTTQLATETSSIPQQLLLTAQVPEVVVAYPLFSFSGVGVSSGGQGILQSPRKSLGLLPVVQVPFGGRRKLVAFTDHEDKHLYLLAQSDEGILIRPIGDDPRGVLLPLPANATVRLSLNPTKASGLTVVQREIVTEDPGGFYVRGTGLSEISPPARMSVEWFDLKEEFDIAVLRRALGSELPEHDEEIIEVADEEGVPPHLLKAQAIQETGSYKNNIRYEPLTRDYKLYTGDFEAEVFFDPPGPQTSQRRIKGDLFKLYAVKGTMLAAPTPNPDCPQFRNTAVDDGLGPTFNVGVPMMRGHGLPAPKPRVNGTYGPAMVDPRVRATIVPNVAALDTDTCQISLPDGEEAIELRLVTNYPVWRKFGRHASDDPNMATFPKGVIEAEHALEGGDTQTDFSVDFEDGTITLGRKVRKGETLVVTYNPVDASNMETIDEGGTFTMDFNDKSKLKEEIKLKFSPPETLFDWFKNNLRAPGNNKPYGNWLTGTKSEKRLEFTVQAGTDKPDVPLDPRFKAMTAQPYLSSSYGTLQMLLDSWLDPRFGQALTDEFDPSATTTPIFNLLNDWRLGLKLGAIRHQNRYNRARTEDVFCNPCTKDEWLKLWNTIFTEFNPDGAGYSGTPLVTIIDTGNQHYEPR